MLITFEEYFWDYPNKSLVKFILSHYLFLEFVLHTLFRDGSKIEKQSIRNNLISRRNKIRQLGLLIFTQLTETLIKQIIISYQDRLNFKTVEFLVDRLLDG